MAYDTRRDRKSLVNWPALGTVVVLIAIVVFIVYRTY